ncbi:MAG: carboxyl transferase domain-containing protein, partial [Bdellovibrionota bacterium]
IDISMASGAGGGKGGGGMAAAGDFISLFANSGFLFREESIMSGVVPLISAMMGPGAAGTAYIPGLADYVPMVKGIGSMALAGPPLVKAVTGEEVDEQTLGGSKIHSEVSGVGDGEFENDDACLEGVKTYLSFMPSSCMEKPPVKKCDDPIDRKEEKLLDVVPESTRRAFDTYDVIKLIADNGEYFDIKPKWARNMVTCFARFGGYPVGIVGNNPKYYGGVIDVNAADKAAHFMEICDAFNVPLLFLHDTPGFMVGTKVEAEGIIRHGAKMLHVMAQATVPKLTVVLRKSYGAGYYAMCGRAYEPDLLIAWPGAEISVMGAEGMVGIAGRAFANRGTTMAPEAVKAMAGMIQPFIDIMKVAHWGFVDDVVDPRETRERICRALETCWNKQVERPWRKHSIRPV